MQFREKFLPNEWRTLQFAPLWVFLTLAGADESIDRREFRVLTDQLAEGENFHEPLVREVLCSVKEEFNELVPDFAQDNRSLEAGFSDVNHVLKTRISPEVSQVFKQAVLLIGHNIAEASGQRLLGSRTGPEEKKALQFVADSLNTPLEEYSRLTDIRQKTVPHNIKLLPRFLLPIIIIALLIMGCYQLMFWSGLEVGHPKENRALILTLLGCLGAPLTIIIGLIYQFTLKFFRNRAQIALGIAVLAIPLLFCGASVAILMFISRPPTGITSDVKGPDQVVKDTPFPIDIEVINEASSAQTLHSIDLEYEAIEIIETEPDYKSKSPFTPGDTYTFQETIPTGGKITVIFTGVISQVTTHEIPIGVCINSEFRCESLTWQVKVVEE